MTKGARGRVAEDLRGSAFNRLTVMERDTTKARRPHWMCRCDLCGARKAVEAMEPGYYTYRNKTKLLWFRHLFCYNCKSDYSGDEELKYNHALIVDFKREVDTVVNKANQT